MNGPRILAGTLQTFPLSASFSLFLFINIYLLFTTCFLSLFLSLAFCAKQIFPIFKKMRKRDEVRTMSRRAVSY